MTKHTQAEKDCTHACHKAQEKMNTPKGHCYHCKPNTQARNKWEEDFDKLVFGEFHHSLRDELKTLFRSAVEQARKEGYRSGKSK